MFNDVIVYAYCVTHVCVLMLMSSFLHSYVRHLHNTSIVVSSTTSAISCSYTCMYVGSNLIL